MANPSTSQLFIVREMAPGEITITMKLPIFRLRRIRFILFVTLFLFSVVMLAMTSALIQSGYPNAEGNGLGVATSILTLFLPLIVLAREQMHTNGFTSWTIFELIWMGVTGVCWLINAALSTNSAVYTCNGVCFRWWNYGNYYGRCSDRSRLICGEIQAVAVFSYLMFLILAILFWWTLRCALRASSKGDKFIWTTAAHAYTEGEIYLPRDAPSPIFDASEANLVKGKDAAQAERVHTPSPPPTL